MKRTILLLAASLILWGCAEKGSRYTSVDGFAQGSTFHIVYEIPSDITDRNQFELAVKDSVDIYFKRINKSVSGYDSTSVLSQLNRGGNPQLDKIFIDVFNYACQIYRESDGAVDASAAPLFDVWGFGFKNRESVTQQKLDSIRQFIGMERVSVSPDNFLVKEDSRIKLNFNAIAQGYTSDYFAARFDDMGIENYLLEIGGEVYCKGLNSKGKEWKVGIDVPKDGNFIPGNELQAIIKLSGKGLVTSGNYRKFYVNEDGSKYSHTVDPKSGYPVSHSLLSATVIAENATVADGYATYFMVVGLERAKEILAATPGMEALLVYGEQDNMKTYQTPGLKKMVEAVGN